MENSLKFEATAKKFAFKTLPESEIELQGEVSWETILPYRKDALKEIAEHLELPGFRKGKVPEDMALKKVGEIAVLEEAVEHFMRDFYGELVSAHKAAVVGRPDIRITKFAPENPVALTIRATVYPEVKLPKDWKKTGEKIALEPAVPATEAELNETLESLRQSRKTKKETGEEEAPELNDEFAKSVGAFQTVEELKTRITKGITEEKERATKDARRGKIIEALLGKVEIEVPKIFVESELEKILSQLKEDVARFGVTFEGYLKQINKTEEALREEFKGQAKKRAKLQLTLNKVAEEEKIEAEAADVAKELKHALEHFPDARQDLLTIHIETVLRNEKTLQLLEKGE